MLAACRPASIPDLLAARTGVVELPAGDFVIARELRIPPDASRLEIRGSPDGTTLRASDDFSGRAILFVDGAREITVRNLRLDGNREALEKRAGLPPFDVPFIAYQASNGIAADGADGLRIESVAVAGVAGFAVLVARSNSVILDRVEVRDSGSRNEKGRNNTTGGILLEEGTRDFTVRNCSLDRVLGNGIWTHSLYTSPRNTGGLITGNRFRRIGRDAIQVGHATRVRVENNTGRDIGHPEDIVDAEGGGTPVAIDTAGNVDQSVYTLNRFEEVNGKCIDLDGFHHGEVSRNTCVNRGPAAQYAFGHYGIVMNNANPDMRSEGIRVTENVIDGAKFGGIFVIGQGHTITGNRLINLNTAGCNESAASFGCSHFPGEPDLLQSGIYLGRRAERPAPASDNLIDGNLISGHKMASRCIGFAPDVSRTANRIGSNQCLDAPDSP